MYFEFLNFSNRVWRWSKELNRLICSGHHCLAANCFTQFRGHGGLHPLLHNELCPVTKGRFHAGKNSTHINFVSHMRFYYVMMKLIPDVNCV